jgi:hypothetical protein
MYRFGKEKNKLNFLRIKVVTPINSIIKINQTQMEKKNENIARNDKETISISLR